MKKKYSVNVHYDVVLSKDVVAESEQEAIDKAIEELTDEDLNEGEVVGEEGCVTNVEDIEPKTDPVEELSKVLGIMGCFGGFYTSEDDKKALIKFVKRLAEELDKE